MTKKRLLGIEISDLGVTAARLRESGAELLPLGSDSLELSGFALLTGKGEVVFGKPAFEHFLTSELAVDNRYWYRLATAEEGSARKNRRGFQPSDSELAQAHLQAVIEKCLQLEARFDEVVLGAPGHFKSSKLGLLILVSQAVGMRVTHILDSSLAALLSASEVLDTGSFVVMDIHWNTAEVAHIVSKDSGLERRDVAEDRVLGLRQIMDRLVEGLAKRFIDECRFDPSARPEYAQQLYNQLLAYLSDPNGASVYKLQAGKGAISIDRSALAEMIGNELRGFSDLVGRAVNHAADSRDCTVFFSSRISHVPGLFEKIYQDHAIKPRLMETGQAATGALAFRGALGDDQAFDQPLFHTAVEFDARREGTREAESMRPGRVYHSGRDGILGPTNPTHLLFQGRLLELPEFGAADFAIGKGKSIASGLAVAEPVEGLAECHVLLRRKEDGSIELTRNGNNQTWVNGESISSNDAITLQVGDVLTLGEPVLQVMIVGMARDDA